MIWKKVGNFAHYEIWAKGNRRVFINPQTKKIELKYRVDDPAQLKIPFKTSN